MKTQRRWIASLVAEATRTDTQMPWERGARRQAMIARRVSNPEPKRQSA